MGHDQSEVDAGAVIDRMRQVLGAPTDIALCKALGVGSSVVSTWRRRNTVPYAECVRLALQHALSLNWLLLGLGTRSASPFAQNAVAEPAGYLPADPRVARMQRFIAAWQAGRDSDDVAWLERTLARAVPEYAEWLAANPAK